MESKNLVICDPETKFASAFAQYLTRQKELAVRVRTCSDLSYVLAIQEKEKIDLLLRAGMAAPSGKDVRPWEFVVVSDRAKLDSMAAALPYAKMLTQARNAIIVCGDSVKSSYWYLDCSAAAQNILLAAESLGFGAVWTAAYPYEDRMQVVRKYTGLPENILPLCVIPFGYPATKENPKQKFDEKKIHYNQY